MLYCLWNFRVVFAAKISSSLKNCMMTSFTFSNGWLSILFIAKKSNSQITTLSTLMLSTDFIDTEDVAVASLSLTTTSASELAAVVSFTDFNVVTDDILVDDDDDDVLVSNHNWCLALSHRLHNIRSPSPILTVLSNRWSGHRPSGMPWHRYITPGQEHRQCRTTVCRRKQLSQLLYLHQVVSQRTHYILLKDYFYKHIIVNTSYPKNIYDANTHVVVKNSSSLLLQLVFLRCVFWLNDTTYSKSVWRDK